MNRFILILIGGFFCNSGIAQDHSDANLMKSQPYMLHADKADCDSMDGNNAEHKICLNLEFQKVDSILNKRFLTYIKEIESDSIRQKIIEYQNAWVLNRRTESAIEAEGYRGHMLSIAYISNMIFITRKRIEELEQLIKYK